MDCPFCDWPDSETYEKGEQCRAFFDKYPISPGHLLIIPDRHVQSIFELPEYEYVAIFKLLAKAKIRIAQEQIPCGFNVGLNDGICAGQTVGHAHLHLIPRYEGDIADPRGGIRSMFPDKGDYWS